MNVFEEESERYEQWFEKHPLVYQSEIAAVRKALPDNYRQLSGMEIGVGSGRFAVPFGITYGVEPAAAMRNIACEKGITAINGKAESLPYNDNIFDFVLLITTICFVDDPLQSCKEAYRVLSPGGSIIVGIVDKTTSLGQEYERKRANSVFYKNATFFSADEIIKLLQQAGFKNIFFYQTLFSHPADMTEPDVVLQGYGKGAFVVIKGEKTNE